MNSGSPEFQRSAPVLQVRDVRVSRDFYRDRLGFEEAGMWGEPPCFCIMGRGTITLFLDQSQNDGPAPVNQYWAAYLYVTDVNALVAELGRRGAGIIRGPEEAPYGCLEIDIRDPDGHVICFGQDLVPSNHGPGL